MISSQLSPPQTAIINVTRLCNAHCAYCGIWWAGRQLPDRQGPSTPEVLALLDSLANLGVSEIVFSGGEPLLKKEIELFVTEANRKGLVTNIYTNGALLSLQKLNKLLQAGIKIVTLSIDSLQPGICASLRGLPWKRINSALQALLEASKTEIGSAAKVRLACTVTGANMIDLPDLVQFAAHNGMEVIFQPYNPVPGVPELESLNLLPKSEDHLQWEKVLAILIALRQSGAPILNSPGYLSGFSKFWWNKAALLQGLRCTAGFKNVVIDANLDVRACYGLPPAGNLHLQNLEELWNSSAYAQLREQMLSGMCSGCFWVCHLEERRTS